jgi:glutamate dehydrogenase/leucine dehydrogenase
MSHKSYWNKTMESIKNLIDQFESKAPEIIFEWQDSLSEAKGWVVINSLRNGAAGGGTRMRKGLTYNEVLSLAKTMEVKFTISGPDIGGAKSGIAFDPEDPRKEEVLDRWYKVVSPLLKMYYGTGGDINVDETSHVVPLTEKYGLWHPQEGIVNGFYKSNSAEKIKKIGQLRAGIPAVIANVNYSPDVSRKYTISDMITGYGVAQSVVHYYKIWGGDIVNKTAIIQGWGNVGAAAGYFLSKAGVKIKGVIDKDSVCISNRGMGEQEITRLFNERKKLKLSSEMAVSLKEGESAFWNIKADIFIPCAASRLVNKKIANKLISNDFELVVSGANVPFDNKEVLYGDIHEKLDNALSVVPDFIANCGMARAFAYLMKEDVEVTSQAIFEDVSNTIYNALHEVYISSNKATQISERAIKTAIKKIV